MQYCDMTSSIVFIVLTDYQNNKDNQGQDVTGLFAQLFQVKLLITALLARKQNEELKQMWAE